MMEQVLAAKAQDFEIPSYAFHMPILVEQAVSSIRLADGTTWFLEPRDSRAESAIALLSEIMRLDPVHSINGQNTFSPIPLHFVDPMIGRSSDISHPIRSIYHLRVSVGNTPSAVPSNNGSNDLMSITYFINEEQGLIEQDPNPLSEKEPTVAIKSIDCRLAPADTDDHLYLQLQQLSQLIALEAELGGGLLLHGGLAEWNGQGIILAGPGSVGKSTAIGRLPAPWRSLSDDMTLIVKDEENSYWAQPWPTWSNFFFGEGDGSWDTQNAIPLKGLFFLRQAHEDQVDSLRQVDAACLLNQSAEQASRPALIHYKTPQLREHRLNRLDSICALVKKAPSFHLYLSLHGEFWFNIQEVISDVRYGQFQE